MPKVTLTFPNPDSLWLFKDKSNAINIAVVPRKNRITGMFSSEEIDIAVKEFQAERMANAVPNTNPSSLNYAGAGTAKSFSRFKFYQLLSMMRL